MAMQRRKILGRTGDKSLYDYDAGVVYENRYGLQWEFWRWENDRDESGKAKAQLYRCNVPDDVFADYDWVGVKGIASLIGADPTELRAMGKSDKIMERVYALEAIAADGPSNLDVYPLEITRADLKKRWRTK